MASLLSRGAGWLYRWQKLILSPVKLPVICGDVQSYCIWVSVSCGDVKWPMS